MESSYNKVEKIAIPLRHLADILMGRCGVVKNALSDDAEIIRIESDAVFGTAVMLVRSDDFEKLPIGMVIPTETRAFAYFDRDKQLADAGLEIDVSP